MTGLPPLVGAHHAHRRSSGTSTGAAPDLNEDDMPLY